MDLGDSTAADRARLAEVRGIGAPAAQRLAELRRRFQPGVDGLMEFVELEPSGAGRDWYYVRIGERIVGEVYRRTLVDAWDAEYHNGTEGHEVDRRGYFRSATEAARWLVQLEDLRLQGVRFRRQQTTTMFNAWDVELDGDRIGEVFVVPSGTGKMRGVRADGTWTPQTRDRYDAVVAMLTESEA